MYNIQVVLDYLENNKDEPIISSYLYDCNKRLDKLICRVNLENINKAKIDATPLPIILKIWERNRLEDKLLRFEKRA